MRKLLLILLFIVLFLNSGCSSSAIHLNYIKTPNKVNIYGKKYYNEIQRIKDEIVKTTDKKISEEYISKTAELTKKSIISIVDKVFIGRLMDELGKLEGKKVSKMKYAKREYILNMEFVFDDTNITEEKIDKRGYLTTIMLFDGEMAYIPQINGDDGILSSYIEIKFDKDFVKYLKEYYEKNA